LSHALLDFVFDLIRFVWFHLFPFCTFSAGTTTADAPTAWTSKLTYIYTWTLSLFHSRNVAYRHRWSTIRKQKQKWPKQCVSAGPVKREKSGRDFAVNREIECDVSVHMIQNVAAKINLRNKRALVWTCQRLSYPRDSRSLICAHWSN
jgi:hypothetical protein